MPITEVKTDMSTVFSGLVHGTPLTQKTAIATEMVYFGKLVGLAAATDIAKTAPRMRLFTAGDLAQGVSVADPTLEALPDPVTGELDGAGYGAHSANKTFTYVKKGQIWVQSETEVASRALGVFVKNEDTLGSHATVVSTTCTVANLGDDTFTVTVSGYAPQTVTLPSSVASADAVAAAINAQVEGVHAVAAGSQVAITTDAIGSGVTIAAADVGTDLVWDTPVDGAGNTALYDWNARGTFRADTAGGSVSGYTEVSGLKWLAKQNTSGKYFGLVQVDL